MLTTIKSSSSIAFGRVTYMNVVDSTEYLHYVLHRPNACGSGCTNFCAPTCFNAIHRTYILDPANGHKVVGELQNIFPGCNARGLCMMNSGADNFCVKFLQEQVFCKSRC